MNQENRGVHLGAVIRHLDWQKNSAYRGQPYSVIPNSQRRLTKPAVPKEKMGEPKKGAGRRSKFLSDAAKKKIEQTEKMSEEFKEAWNKYIEQIAKAKRWGWQETSKIAAIQATQTCFDIIEAR